MRKSVARQHTKDLQEYMKQIHAKDKELSELKRKLAKVSLSIKNINTHTHTHTHTHTLTDVHVHTLTYMHFLMVYLRCLV